MKSSRSGPLERDRIELTAEFDERITRVWVIKGDHVDAGTPLVQQDTTRAEIALVKA